MSEPSSDFDALVATRLGEVRERIAQAGGRDVTVLPVTKAFGVEACWAAWHAGLTAVGENYAQEVVAKLAGIEERPFAVHFIGQLQTNKVRVLAPIVSLYETVDRDGLVDELAKRVPGAQVLVQADTSDEPGKGGCALAQVPALVERAVAAGLVVRGLMTVGPTEGGPHAAAAGFRAVRALVDRLGLSMCSMGMTDDLEIAVQEGSTQVRVGSALFGKRPSPGTPVR